jgi:group I intron endonuclease
MAYIYFVRNIVNGKTYIGKTRKSIKERWVGHLCDSRHGSHGHLHQAIRKYGPESFEVIEFARTEDLSCLDELEILFIALFMTTNPLYGYNITKGGEGNRSSATLEQRLKVSAKLKGRPQPWVSKNLKGRVRSLDHAAHLAESNRGKKRSPESIARMTEANRGRPPITSCKRGHLFDEANTYINGKGHRICRQCRLYRDHQPKGQIR